MKYQAPYGSSDPNAPYINGNPATGQPGSIPPAAAFEQPQREILAAITASGQTPDPNDLTQLWKAIIRAKQGVYGVDTGSANALVIDPAPASFAYTAGSVFLVKVAETNTGPATIDVNGLGPKTIIRTVGVPLGKGDLVAGGIAMLVYDGAAFQLESVPAVLMGAPEASFVHFGVDTGPSANAVIINGAVPAISAYAAGVMIAFVAGNTNNAAATININGLGNKALSRGSGGALQAGDLVSGTMGIAVYDGTRFQLLNTIAAFGGGGGGGGTLPANYDSISGPIRPYWLAVLSATVTAPPASPVVGDAYLIPASGATGAWAGLGNRIAQYTGGGWVSRDYPVASITGVADSGKYLRRTASGWETFYAPPHRDYQTITSSVTASAGGAYLCDTSAGSFNLSLPASPTENDRVTISDGGNFNTNALFVLRNGAPKIHGIADDLGVDAALASFSLIYRSGDWRIV